MVSYSIFIHRFALVTNYYVTTTGIYYQLVIAYLR